MIEQRLLVVDDDSRIAELVSLIATEVGFISRTATTSNTILDARDNFKPDVIVLDILMPVMNGLGVLKLFSQPYNKIHIIILSGSLDTEPMIAENFAVRLGFTVYANLKKPFAISEMRKVLEKIKVSLDSI
jgi:two-component system OmpR family response regulator